LPAEEHDDQTLVTLRLQLISKSDGIESASAELRYVGNRCAA
jgi:hypothetical protein